MPKEKAEKSLCMSGLRHAEYYGIQETIFYKGIMPSEKVLDIQVDCNTLTGSVNL